MKPKPTIDEIINTNPKLNLNTLKESMEIVKVLRKSGLERPYYNVVSPYDVGPSVATLDESEADQYA